MVLFFCCSIILFACKKDAVPSTGSQNLSYTVIDTLGNSYSFSDFTSNFSNAAGSPEYYFNGNTIFTSNESAVYIMHNLSDNGYEIHIQDYRSFMLNQNNTISLQVPSLQNTNLICDINSLPDIFFSFQLNTESNSIYTPISHSIINTDFNFNQDSTVSGTFNIIAYTQSYKSYYTISGSFNRANYNK